MDSGDRDVVVLTGATGFLGRELLWKLMKELPASADIVCIVRPGQSGRADQAAPGPRSPHSAQEAAGGRLAPLPPPPRPP